MIKGNIELIKHDADNMSLILQYETTSDLRLLYDLRLDGLPDDCNPIGDKRLEFVVKTYNVPHVVLQTDRLGVQWV